MNHTFSPVGKGNSHTAHMHACEESDSGVLPMNRSNKDGEPLAEGEEGRSLIKENTHQLSTHSTQSEVRVSQGLEGVRKAAKEGKEKKFTALLHHMTVGLLREGFYALKRKAAPGVDGVTWEEYESGLEDRLVDLHSRVHRGRVSCAAIKESVYSEARWTATAIRGCGAGGQDCPACRGHDPQSDI